MNIMVKTALIIINTQEMAEKIIPHKRASKPGLELSDASVAGMFSTCWKAALTLI
jgi:hypothetical protein